MRWPLPTFRVTIERHSVPPRWLIPARSSTTVAADGDQARMFVIREAHAAAGVPPMRPLTRISLGFATATRTDRPARMKTHDPRKLRIAA